MSTDNKVLDIAQFKKKKVTTIDDIGGSILTDAEINTFIKVCNYLRQVSEPKEAINVATIVITGDELKIETRHPFDVFEDENTIITETEMVMVGTMPFDQATIDVDLENFRKVLLSVSM